MWRWTLAREQYFDKDIQEGNFLVVQAESWPTNAWLWCGYGWSTISGRGKNEWDSSEDGGLLRCRDGSKSDQKTYPINCWCQAKKDARVHLFIIEFRIKNRKIMTLPSVYVPISELMMGEEKLYIYNQEWSPWDGENALDHPHGPFLWEDTQWVRGCNDTRRGNEILNVEDMVTYCASEGQGGQSQVAAHCSDARWKENGNSDSVPQWQGTKHHQGMGEGGNGYSLPSNSHGKEYSPSTLGGLPPKRHYWLWPEGLQWNTLSLFSN